MSALSLYWPVLIFLAIVFVGTWFSWRDLDGRKSQPKEPEPQTRRVRCISGELKPSFDSRKEHAK